MCLRCASLICIFKSSMASRSSTILFNKLTFWNLKINNTLISYYYFINLGFFSYL